MKILIEKNKIDDTVKELGNRISRDYADKNPVMVGVLKGAFMFMADLLRRIDIPCEFSRWMTSPIQRVSSGFIPAAGSSRSRQLGFVARAMARPRAF